MQFRFRVPSVQENRLIVLLVKPLHVASLVKLSVWPVHSPIDFDVHLIVVAFREEVFLTIENVEIFIQAGDDVPPLLLRPIVDGDVLFRLNRVKIRHRIFPRRLSLRHARVPGHRARVKFLHRRRRVQIPASNLTIRLVRFPETHVQARQRFHALLVSQAPR